LLLEEWAQLLLEEFMPTAMIKENQVMPPPSSSKP